MKVIKFLLSLILSFALCLCILAVTTLYVANKYTDKEYFISKLEEINIYDSIYEEINSGFENYIYQSGLEPEIFNSLCTKEKIKNDILLIVDGTYSGKEVSIDSSEIRNNLENSINQAIANQGRKLTKTEKENIAKFEYLIEQVYKDNLNNFQKIEMKLGSKLLEVFKYIKLGYKISIIATVTILIVLFLINIKQISVAFSFLGISMVASGIIEILFKNYLFSKVEIDNLLVFTEALSNVVSYIIKEFIYSVQNFGIISLGIGILLIIWSSIIYKK